MRKGRFILNKYIVFVIFECDVAEVENSCCDLPDGLEFVGSEAERFERCCRYFVVTLFGKGIRATLVGVVIVVDVTC